MHAPTPCVCTELRYGKMKEKDANTKKKTPTYTQKLACIHGARIWEKTKAMLGNYNELTLFAYILQTT